jgi:uncharacterized protein YjiK
MKFFLGTLLSWSMLSSSAAAQEVAVSFRDGPSQQFALVNGLREVSGLAIASKNSVYAHDDEYGIVYEIDLADGAVKAAFALGDPTVRADFEGIAAENGRVYLATSTGLIYEALTGPHRGRVRYNVYDTGVGAFCEVEGLSRAQNAGDFFVLCKTARIAEFENRLVIFRWNVRDRQPVAEPWMNIPYRDFLKKQNIGMFRPSAVEWDRDRKMLVVLSARSRQLVAMDEGGRLLFEKALSADIHAQAEGMTLMPSGDLVIADEGRGRSPGKLSIYRLRR